MRKVVPIGAGLVLAALSGWGSSPARAQWFVRPYPFAYPPAYYPPPPVYRPVYPPPPMYAPPVYAPPPPPRPSAALMETQRQLAQLGYDPGPLDGLAGPRLSDAVQAFQRDHDQSPNGRLTGETVGAIREAARTRESQTSVPLPSTSPGPSSGASNLSNYAPPPSAPSSSAPRPMLSVKPTVP